MMDREAILFLLRKEALGTALYALGGAALGALWGSKLQGLALALVVLLAHHLLSAARLRVWQKSPKKHALPSGSGVWAEIYDGAISRYQQARKRKKKLASIVKEFRSSTSALPDAAVVLDKQGHISWYNPAASEMLGLRASRDLGQRIANLIRHPAFVAYFNDGDENLYGVEIPGLVDAERTLWVRLVPYGQSQRLLIARDITDRKQMEQMRRDFVSNASHELRTPLTVVSGYLEMMSMEAASDRSELASWREPLEQMHRQSQRMERIIVDMLKLARLEGPARVAEFEPLNMVRMLKDALSEAAGLSDGRHEIRSDIAEGVSMIGQSAEIQSVVSNLLSNAIRYTPDGGAVDLRWHQVEGRPVLEVRDSGIGIPQKDIARLTERFYRADVARSRETGGTGLGLAIVKHAVERQGGQLEIESVVGQGSCFRCVFSATPIQAAS